MFPFKNFIFEGFSHLHGQGSNGHGRRNACADYEMNYIECLEAYGLHRGREECQPWWDDLYECKNHKLAAARRYLMEAEHVKKLARGERDWKDRRGKPYAYDSYIEGCFWP